MQSKDRTYQVVAIVALIIGVFALSIGFAAFSTTLTIKSAAEVTPAQEPLNVKFSTSNTSYVAGTVNGVDAGTVTGATADVASLADTTIQNINAKFTKPGQSVTYSFNAYNGSSFDAYLTGITFKNVDGSSPAATKVCTAKAGTNPASNGVDEACADITISVSVGTHTATGSETSTEIGTHKLEAGQGETIVVTITYLNGTGHGHEADGDFTVSFGDIALSYSTVNS